ncbi:hypothetical protein JN535_01735 [Cellulosimicrobium cellulans]|uniref:hypothetical protein n=1 Tax=Cellulosimicrobium cellulans TaxID=1710 RepID=UPI00196282AD|nr:hypothetical protein [Cellulosimicrobium cellulans]MBN0038892.1 hypothetical protein [Cellulosimicrobium cellulans]
MGIPTTVIATRFSSSTRARLTALGLDLPDGPPGGTTPGVDEPAPTPALPDLGAALRRCDEQSALAVVVDRDASPDDWRRDGVRALAEVTVAAAAGDPARPLTLLVLPAVSGPRPGPVAILSASETVSAYELFVGAGLACASGLDVEHLNARGVAGSAIRTDAAGRAAARSATAAWHERADPRPERALRTGRRPAAIVATLPPGSVDAARVVADHPDADVVLVLDRVHARHGAALARQVATMVEIAFDLATMLPEDGSRSTGADASGSAPKAPPPARTPPDGLAPLRASDVLHARLTDTAVEVTNRTRQNVRCRVVLGAAEAPDVGRAVLEVVLGPDASSTEPTAGVGAVADLAPPTAVLRHWSHTSTEVYEGGDLRILQVELDVLDATGAVRATRAYDAGNGTDFAVTARDLGSLLGRASARPVLPDPAPSPVVPVPAPDDLLATFARSLAVGATALARPVR